MSCTYNYALSNLIRALMIGELPLPMRQEMSFRTPDPLSRTCGEGLGTRLYAFRAVYNHWTGLLEWTTGMDYWTDLFCTKNHFCDF